MKPICVALIVLGLNGSPLAAQVSVVEQSKPDGSFTRAEVHFDTLDRSFVPLKTETREQKINDTTVKREAVVQTRLANGEYAVTERTASVTEQVSPEIRRTITDVVKVDRQGKSQPNERIVTTVTETPAGTETVMEESRRNSSGELVAGRQITELTRQTDARTTTRSREIRERDVNGRLVLTREVAETTVTRSPQEEVRTAMIRSDDHMTGRFTETARETTTVRTQGNTKAIERTIATPRGASWEVHAKTVTRETESPTGVVERETIQYQKPLHAAFSPTSTEPLKPKLKIVEKAVRRADGRVVMEREVYFRDVNNEWKPQTFSTDFGGSGQRNYGR